MGWLYSDSVHVVTVNRTRHWSHKLVDDLVAVPISALAQRLTTHWDSCVNKCVQDLEGYSWICEQMKINVFGVMHLGEVGYLRKIISSGAHSIPKHY